MHQFSYTVTGMTCSHCADSITRELMSVPGVRQVDVDVQTGQVTVTSDSPLSVEDVRQAVTEAGFELAA
ncbi:MAG: heavy-metal-associated domain-containing protein [Actinopolymorphaceae bacterium]